MRFSITAAVLTFLIIAASKSAVVTAKHNEITAALELCAMSAVKDVHGTPDQKDINLCMKSKGFKLPPRSLAA